MKTSNPKEDSYPTELFIHWWQGYKMAQKNHFGKLFDNSYQTYTHASSTTGRPVLSARTHEKTCTWVFRAGVTRTAETGNNPTAHQQKSGKTAASCFSGKRASIKKSKLTAHTTGMNLTGNNAEWKKTNRKRIKWTIPLTQSSSADTNYLWWQTPESGPPLSEVQGRGSGVADTCEGFWKCSTFSPGWWLLTWVAVYVSDHWDAGLRWMHFSICHPSETHFSFTTTIQKPSYDRLRWTSQKK